MAQTIIPYDFEDDVVTATYSDEAVVDANLTASLASSEYEFTDLFKAGEDSGDPMFAPMVINSELRNQEQLSDTAIIDEFTNLGQKSDDLVPFLDTIKQIRMDDSTRNFNMEYAAKRGVEAYVPLTETDRQMIAYKGTAVMYGGFSWQDRTRQLIDGEELGILSYAKPDEDGRYQLLGGAGSKLVGDIAGELVPFNFAHTVYKIYNEVFGFDLPEQDVYNDVTPSLTQKTLQWGMLQLSKAEAVVSPGLYIRGMRAELDRLPPNEKYDLTKKILTALKRNAGYLGGNDAIALELIDTLFAEETDSFLSTGFTSRLYDIANLADLIGMGKLARDSVKQVGRFGINSALLILRAANPQAYRDAAANLVSRVAAGERLRGVDDAAFNVIMRDMVPKLPTSNAHATIDASSLANAVERLDREGDLLVGKTFANKFDFQDEEIQALEGLVTDYYRNVTPYSYRVGMSSYDATEVGMEVQAVYGATDDHGFATIADALKATQPFPERERLATTVLEFDPVSGIQTREITDVLMEPSVEGMEYFTKINTFESYDDKWFDPQKLTFGPNSVHLGGTYLGDIGSNLSYQWATRYASNVDKQRQLSKDLIKLLDKDFFSIKDLGTKQRILNVFEETKYGIIDMVPKWNPYTRTRDLIPVRRWRVYTSDDLVKNGLVTAEEQAGYYALIKKSQVEHALLDKRYTHNLRSEGWQMVHWNNVADKTAGPRKIFSFVDNADEATKMNSARYQGKIIQLNQNMKDSFRNQGKIFMKTRSPIKEGNHITFYEIIDPTDIKVSEIPKFGNLKYYPGAQFMDIYNGDYTVIKSTEAIINGGFGKYDEIMGTIPDTVTGNNLVETLNSQFGGNGVSYRWERAKELGMKSSDDILMGIASRKHLDLSESMDDMSYFLRHTSKPNPVDNLAQSSARVAMMDRDASFISTLKKRFMNDYKEVITNRNSKGELIYPTTVGHFTEFHGLKPGSKAAEARKVWKYINLLESGYMTAKFNMWRNGMITIAENIEKLGLRAPLFRSLGKKDPTTEIRKAAFWAYIGGNPFRQATLQAAQTSVLVGLDPMYSFTQLPQESLGMVATMWLQGADGYDDLVKQAAKSMGWVESDLRLFADAMKNSGLYSSIDAHMMWSTQDSMKWFKENMNASALSRAGSAMANTAKIPGKLAKTLGFDAGEGFNLTATGMISLRRWIKANPGKNWRTPRALQEIFAQARLLSGNMATSGAFGYQEGYLSVATQFWGFQHKMGLLVTPKYGSKFLTNAEKGRIALSQLLMYGTAGMGLAGASKWAVDKYAPEAPDWAYDVLAGGLTDYAVQKIMENAGLPPAKISESIAPIGGVANVGGKLVEAALNQNLGLVEAFGGVAFPVVTKAWHTFNLIRLLYGLNRVDDSEKLQVGINALGANFSGYDNWLTARAIFNHGKLVSKSGDVLGQAQWSDGVTKMFGFNTELEARFYDYLDAVDMGSGEVKRYVDRAAKEYVKQLNQITTRYADTMPETDWELHIERMKHDIAVQRFIIDNQDEEVRVAIANRVHELMAKAKLGLKDRVQRDIESIMNKGGNDELEFMIRRAERIYKATDPNWERTVQGLRTAYEMMTKNTEKTVNVIKLRDEYERSKYSGE